MRHRRSISGTGILMCDGEEIARVSYELENIGIETTGVMRSGELRISADALKGVFGREDVQLLTDDGRIFDLRLSNKVLRPATDGAHVDDVDASDALQPAAAGQKWRH